MNTGSVLQLAVWFSLGLLTLSIVLVFLRMLRGPSICNRVIALDLITTLMVCVMGVYIILTGGTVLMQVTIVAALITFLGTVGYAYYVEREKK